MSRMSLNNKTDHAKTTVVGNHNLVWKLLFGGILAIAAQSAYAVAFNDTFDTDTGTTTSFTRSLGGVSYTYTFTANGDGGDTIWQSNNGDGGSASILLTSGSYNTGTTERFTIARTDGTDFTLTSIHINNSGGETVTVGGYNGGVLVGSTQNVPNGSSSTLNFGGIGVDEVRVTSNDFFNTNVDSFVGDTDPPNNAPTDITLSATSINTGFTGAGAAIGTLSTTDADGGDTHTYSLVANSASGNGSCGAAGDDHNASFQVDNINDELETAGSVAIGTYSVCVQTSDGTASYQESFTISVTGDSDATLTAAAGVTEPVGLDTTADTVGEAVDVFDFTISDGGTADGLATTISQIVVNVSGTSTDAERGQVTWRLNGPDASNVTGTYNAGADTITFSGLSISIADSGNETYTVNAYYNDNLSLTEDHTFILSVDGDTDVTVGSAGTQMSAGQSAVTNGVGSTIDVVATQLVFTTQPAGSASGSALTTQPVVAARDAFGNTDVDFTETITVTEASAGSLSNNTQAATNGVATFTNLTYTATADQQSFTLTANDQDGVGTNLATVDANAVTSDVVATKLIFNTQPAPTTIDSGSSTDFTTDPVIQAVDANDLLDTGYSTNIVLSITDPNDGTVDGTVNSLTGTGDSDGDGTTVTLTPSSGSATFTNLALQYTNSGASESIALRATSGGLTAANSSTITSLVNNAPVIANLNGDSVSWAGVGTSVNLDSGGNATASDTELDALNGGFGNYSGGSLSVQRAGGAVTGDVFGFDTSGALFTINGSDLQDGGQTFATFTNTNGVLTISFTSSGTPATTALVTDVMQRITYRNDTPAGDATVRFTLSDGSATDTADVTVTTDNIYITNTTDTATIDPTDGTSFSEAIAIAAADGTGTQTLILDSSLAAQTVSTTSATSLTESLTLDMDSASGVTLSGGTLTVGGGVTLTLSNGTSDTATLSTTLAGTGNLNKAGAGTLTLGSTSNSGGADGNITISAGTLAVSSDANLANGTVTLAAGTTLQVNSATNVDNSISLTGDATVQVGSNATLSGTLSGNFTLTKTGAATLTLSSNSNEASLTGGMLVSAGTLSVSGDDQLSAGTITLNGGTLNLSGSSFTVDNAIALGAGGGTISVVTASKTISGVISGSGALAKTGGPSLTLSASNTWSGGVSVSGVNGLSVTDGSNLGSGAVTLNGSSLLTVTGSGVTISNNLAMAGDATVSNANNITWSGVISGASALTKSGAGTLTLSGTQTHSGGTTVSAGAISIAGDGNLGTGTLTLDGGTLTVTGSGVTIDNAFGLGASHGTVNNANDITLSGVLSGSGNLTKTGAGNLTLSATNTFTGSTALSAGQLTVSGSLAGAVTAATGTTLESASSIGGLVTINSGATLQTGSSPGGLTLSNGLTVNTGGTLIARINGTTAGSQYDQYDVTGTVTLGGTLSLIGSHAGSGGNTFVIINNDGVDAVSNTFSGLAEGDSSTTLNTIPLTVSYIGSSGNDVTLSVVPPAITDGNISISGATGTGGAYKIGDTVTVTWDDTAATGDNNGDISSVTVNFSAFGGGAAVTASNSSDTWTATYTIVSGAIDNTNLNVSVTATDNNGISGTAADTTNATVDNIAPAVTDANISISGATGSGGAFKIGDTVTATWNNTAGGDNNSDTISSVTVDFSQFGGGAAVAATNSSGTWTATYTNVAGAIDGTNLNISVTATDNAGNGTTTADTANATVDNVALTVTDANISISGATGTGGTFIIGDTVTATWNNTAGGDNNSDAISSVTVDFSQFGGGNAVAATNSGGTWTATYTIVSGTVDGTNRNVNVTATDNAGNGTTAADTSNASVDNQAPSVGSVALPGSGTYTAGQNLDFTVNYNDAVTVTGTPRLVLTIGSTTRYASYISGSGTTALLFRYTVQNGDNDSDGIALSTALETNGGTLRDAVGNDASINLGTIGSLVSVLVDTQGPSIGSATLPANATYTDGQNLDFTVNYDEAVTVTGTPRLVLTIGATTRYATYTSGSGTAALLFRYTVQGGDDDGDGISLNTTLDVNGGSLRDAVDNDANTSLGTVGSLAGVLVDAQGPSVSSVTLPSDGTYVSGQNFDFTVSYGETITVNTTGGTPRLVLTVGSSTRYASYTSGSGTNALLFRYTVQSGDNDNDGISLNSTLDTNGGSLRDAANNNAGTNLGATGSLASVLVDTQVPSVDSVSLPANGSYREGQNLDFTVNYDEAVTVDTTGGTPRLTLTVGATTRHADYVSGSGSTALLFRYTVQAGDNDGDGISLNTTLDVNGGTLRDTANNNAATNLGTIGSLASVLVDTQVPAIASVTLPANATYLLGENLDFTVNYDENVTVDTAGGTPRLALTIGAATQYAGYVSGSGTSALLFRYTVQNGDSDGDGIGLNSTLEVNSGTLRDTAGNDAGTDLGTNNLSGVLVDALDTDGDGVSDVQEGIDGTDPNDPDDYLDITAPVVTAPADLVIDATGLYTPVTLRQLLGLAPTATDEEVQLARDALANDNIDGADCCNTQAQGLENDRVLLQPGQTQIVWQGSDRKNNSAQAVQNVNVRPLVSVGKDQTGVEGGSVNFRVILNGASPFYPLEVPFVIDTTQSSADSTDHDLVDGTVTFNADETETSVTINLTDDMVPEGDEILVVRLDDQTDDSEDLSGGYDPFNINDINSGARTQQTVTITEGNVAPAVTLSLQQNAVNVALVANDGGNVTVTANVTDPNPGDTHSYDWSSTDSQLSDTDGDVTDASFVFDPALLSEGALTVQVTVNDGSETVTRRLHFQVVAQAPVLDPLNDSDGDGIDDATEGLADSDNDGIADYLDNIAANNVLPETDNVTDAYLIETEPGVRAQRGRVALANDDGGARINETDLLADDIYNNIGGLFDFEIHELPVAGQSIRVVLPQIAAIPADAAYRKFDDDQWFTFVEDANNAVHSAPGEAGFCPPPGDASWEPGLLEGYFCVQLTIEDGGANDADGLANRSVEDPGGVGEPVAVNPPVSSWTIHGKTKGGGGALGLPAGLALLLLVLLRHRRRAAAVCALVTALLAPSAQAQEQKNEGSIDEPPTAEVAGDADETPGRWQRLLENFEERGYLTLGLYTAEGDQERDDFVSGMADDGVNVGIQEYDVSRSAYQLSLGYRYLPGMAVEFGYLDLGDVNFAFTASAADAATVNRALSQNLPISSDGWLLTNRFDFMFGNWRTSANAGVYFWDGKAAIDNPTINANLKDGTDPLLGLEVAYPLPAGLELSLQYRRILFDDQAVALWGGGLSWSF